MATDVLSHTNIVRVTPTITTSAYAAGDSIGGAIELPNACRLGKQSGVVQSINVIDKDSEEATLDLHFFSAAPTATDNAEFDPTDAQLADSYLGSVNVASYNAFADNSAASVQNVGIPFELAQDVASLYVVITTTGTPTYTAATDISLAIGILQD